MCHSCGFACQQRVLKTFHGPGYLHSEDGVVWLWHLLVDLCIYMAHHFILLWLNSCNLSVDRGGMMIWALCHSCRFACQKRVLKTFPGHGYLRSEDGVAWLCHLLVNLYMYMYLYIYIYIYIHSIFILLIYFIYFTLL